jgi:hypothetical protein
LVNILTYLSLGSQNYEETASSNIQNLVLSDKGVKGRVTLAEVKEEPYDPVNPNDMLGNPFEKLQNEESKNYVEISKKTKKRNDKIMARRSILMCGGYSAIMVGIFMIDHLIQAFRKF